MTVHLTDFDKRSGIITAPRVQPVLISKTSKRSAYLTIAKRGFDLAAVLLAAPLVAPLILVMAALVALKGGQPFYLQTRIGRNGQPFRMWKLRTMVPDAKDKLESYLNENPAARQEWEQLQKLKNDPRVTRIGRLLRKTSLDELPQLVNVLNGSMSLVGPRPMMPEQQELYAGSSYYALRPGITGFWQISDRNDCEFSGRARYDDAYYKSVSLRTDLTVLFRTVSVVLRGTGY